MSIPYLSTTVNRNTRSKVTVSFNFENFDGIPTEEILEGLFQQLSKTGYVQKFRARITDTSYVELLQFDD